MHAWFDRRFAHYLALTLAAAALLLPNLGRAVLWDIDEGLNAECAREMAMSGNWIVPTFNYELRDAKPVLLYWLQIASYRCFGVNEFGARFPSALMVWVAMLMLYELGRQMYGRRAGLLAGLMLGTSIAACVAGHFANPDALLNACVLLAMWLFYRDYDHNRGGWFLSVGAALGLAMLAKGPVGVLLPIAAMGLFLTWERQLPRLLDYRLPIGLFMMALVAFPWYIWVGLETKGAWLRGFFLKHNLDRALTPMESHSGPFFYYLVVMFIGFVPWSLFAGAVGSYCWTVLRRVPLEPRDAFERDRSHARYLICWIGVWLLSFTVARTKLPNYILPLYPALALLSAGFFERWRVGRFILARPWMPLALVGVATAGVVTIFALLIGGGAIPLSLLRGHVFPELSKLAGLGSILLAGGVLGFWALRRQARGAMIATVASAAVVYSASMVALVPLAFNEVKGGRAIAEALPPGQLTREVRLGAYGWLQPSLVFYCQRGVRRLTDEPALRDFLSRPHESYLCLPEEVWVTLSPSYADLGRPVSRQFDFYKKKWIVVVANELGWKAAEAAEVDRDARRADAVRTNRP